MGKLHYERAGCREEQGISSEGVEVGDLPRRKRQPDQAVIDLFRHYGGGQAAGKDALKELLNKLFA
jgi:hypothetical protein